MEVRLSYAQIGALIQALDIYNNKELPHDMYLLCTDLIDAVFRDMTSKLYGDMMFDDWCNEFGIQIL